MKALLITNDFPPMAGGEATWYERICASMPAGRVVVLAPHIRGDSAFDVRQPYSIIRRRVPMSPQLPARLVQIIMLFVSAVGIVYRQRIDAIHIGHLYLGPIALALKHLRRTPYVIYLHGGEMASYMRLPVVRTVVHAIVSEAQITVVNSAYTRRLYEALGIRHPRTEILTFAVDTNRFHPDLDALSVRSRYELNQARLILTVGRLIERKGHDTVIRALSRIRQAIGPVRYLIVGTGPEERRLRLLAHHLGCAHEVIFTGKVPQDELPSLYVASDVFVMPSRTLPQRDGIEGFGIVFLEAGACGRPVVGGRGGGIAEAVLDGVTGMLVDPLDVQELADALIHLLGNREEATRLGKEGRLRAERLASAWRASLERVWSH